MKRRKPYGPKRNNRYKLLGDVPLIRSDVRAEMVKRGQTLLCSKCLRRQRERNFEKDGGIYRLVCKGCLANVNRGLDDLPDLEPQE